MNEKEFLQTVFTTEKQSPKATIVTEEVSYQDISHESRVTQFKETLFSELRITMTPHELIDTVVSSALTSEFGNNLSDKVSPIYIRMKQTIIDSIISHTDLKEQTLALANRYLKKKIGADNQPLQ